RLKADGGGGIGDPSGKTPYRCGKLIVQSGGRQGNCGAMDCVAMFYAHLAGVPLAQMWLVTAENQNTRSYTIADCAIKGCFMEFGHSWALLGTPANEEFIVDPWAGVCCRKALYSDQLRAQLDKWHQQGKRVLVQWDVGGQIKSWWTN